jgi:hypothetical protein
MNKIDGYKAGVDWHRLLMLELTLLILREKSAPLRALPAVENNLRCRIKMPLNQNVILADPGLESIASVLSADLRRISFPYLWL